jgi:molecular chaperone DnaK
LNDEEIERMKKEAEAHATEDEKIKNDIEVINNADATVYSTEKMLEELKDKLTDEQKKSVQAKVDVVKAELAKEQKDINLLKTNIDELNKQLQEIGTQVYQQSQATDAQQETGSGDGQSTGKENQTNKEGDEKVVDAEFEEKNDDTK